LLLFEEEKIPGKISGQPSKPQKKMRKNGKKEKPRKPRQNKLFFCM